MALKLCIVPTPIGNLDDITKRAENLLKTADYIYAEDTREIKKLLNLLNISSAAQIFSYRDHNHDYAYEKFLELLQNEPNATIALVSDRGTPLISDPGFLLLREIYEDEEIKKQVKVEVLPGATALIPALIISELPTDRFSFLGFLPRKRSKQLDLIEEFTSTAATTIVYESPYRIGNLLENLMEYEKLSETKLQVSLVKDVSKLHEKVFTGTTEELLQLVEEKESNKNKLRGEWVVLWRES